MLRQRWSDKDIAHVRRLAEIEGYSASQIGEVYEVSRNAIIGLCHRNDITLKRKQGRPFKAAPPAVERTPRLKAPKRQYPTTKKPPRKPYIAPAPSPLTSAAQAHHSLRINQCRWPIGHPKGEFAFCQSDRVGWPYCEAHTRQARSAAHA